MPRTAWRIRCSFSTSAKRTKPSPPGRSPRRVRPRPWPRAPGAPRRRASPSARTARARAPRRTSSPAPGGTTSPRGQAAAERRAASGTPRTLHRGLRRLVHRRDRGDLDRLERPVVEPALQPGERRADLGVADEEPDAPPGHRERLRERVQLDRDVARARHLQDRRRLVPVEREVGVGEVVHDEHLALARERDDPLHEVELDGRRGRVVREERSSTRGRGDARPYASARFAKRSARRHRDLEHARTREHGRVDVDGVARRGHEGGVAGLDEHPHEVHETLLRAHGRDDLGLLGSSSTPKRRR